MPINKEITLIGHSLGCKLLLELMSYRFKLNTSPSKIYFMGAALSKDENFNKMLSYESITINCFSNSDYVLKYLYRGVEKFDEPIGLCGSDINKPNFSDLDCSDFIKGHTKYFENLKRIYQN